MVATGMADIFISYKREDRARIAPIARALEQRGYTVWWDLELVAGQKWAKTIKHELDQAKCVIVAWSKACVGGDKTYVSEWVENEANEAARRNILLPVLLDADRVAWTHQQRHYATLVGWRGDPLDAQLNGLIEGLEQLVGRRATPSNAELEAWRDADDAVSVAAFQHFLQRHPQSRFAAIAKQRLEELEEAAAWADLGASPSSGAAQDFARRFPGGRFYDLASTLAQRDVKAKRTHLKMLTLADAGADAAFVSAVKAEVTGAGHTTMSVGLDEDADCILVIAQSAAAALANPDIALPLYRHHPRAPVIAVLREHVAPVGCFDAVYSDGRQLCAGLAQRTMFAGELRQMLTPSRLTFLWGERDSRRFTLPDDILSARAYGVFAAPGEIELCIPDRLQAKVGASPHIRGTRLEIAAASVGVSFVRDEIARADLVFALCSEAMFASSAHNDAVAHAAARGVLVLVKNGDEQAEQLETLLRTGRWPGGVALPRQPRVIDRTDFKNKALLSRLSAARTPDMIQ